MAAAAALAFELVQRVWDAFGIPDEEAQLAAETRAKERGIAWEDYRPGVSIQVRQSKTGKRITIPLYDPMLNGERLLLYPELEARLAAVRPAGAASGPIVVEERTVSPTNIGG